MGFNLLHRQLGHLKRESVEAKLPPLAIGVIILKHLGKTKEVIRSSGLGLGGIGPGLLESIVLALRPAPRRGVPLAIFHALGGADAWDFHAKMSVEREGKCEGEDRIRDMISADPRNAVEPRPML